jgi:hypothetical protein
MFVIKSFQDQVIIQSHLKYEQYKDEYWMYIVYYYNERFLMESKENKINLLMRFGIKINKILN